MKKKKLFLFLLIFGIRCLAANVIHVPGDQPTIQGGLNAAVQGDTILVAAGIYVENITWPPINGINLIGSGEDNCIIDGDSLASVIRFESDLGGIIDTSTLINGFTIQNGYAQGVGPNENGGGIYCFSASPSLINLNITHNKSFNSGGGIYCDSSSPLINNVTLTHNDAITSGGGVSLLNSYVAFENVNFTFNIAVFVHGGGIETVDSEVSLIRCKITNNYSGGPGGGIVFYGPESLIIINSTLANNTAWYSGPDIYCPSSNLIIINSIIWNYSPNTIVAEMELVQIFYSDVIGGWIGEGNISEDPQFIDFENSNYTLQANSPCRDTGTAYYVFDGDTLINLNPGEYNGTAPDMGAIEYNSFALGDLNQDGSVNILDVVIIVSIILGDEPTEWEAYAADMNSDGSINVTDIVLIVNVILGD